MPETKTPEFANSVDLDEVAHNEPHRPNLQCFPSSLSILTMIHLVLTFFFNICGRKFCCLFFLVVKAVI